MVNKPKTLYGNSRELLEAAERKNELLAQIAGETYTNDGNPSTLYNTDKALLAAAQKENELLEAIAEGAGTISGANKLAIDYATDILSLKKGDTAIANSGVTLPAYGLNYDSATGGLTLTKNGTAMSGQTVSLPPYGAPSKADSAEDMTDETKVYVYTGETTADFTNGYWYIYDAENEEWVEGGVYNATAFETDDTLSVEGAAADAKAAGDAIGEVSDYVGMTEDVTPDATSGNYVVWLSGNLGTDSHYSYSEPVAVEAGEMVYLKGKGTTSVAMISLCDSSGDNVVPVVRGTGDVAEFRYLVRSDGYIKISYHTSAGYELKIYGNSAVTAIDERTSELEAEAGNLTDGEVAAGILPIVLDQVGFFYGTNSETINPRVRTANDNYACACVECKPGDKFTIHGGGATANTRPWAFADASYGFISKAAANEVNEVVTAPENAKYLFVNNKVVTYGTWVSYYGDSILKKIEGIQSGITGLEEDVTALEGDVSDLEDADEALETMIADSQQTLETMILDSRKTVAVEWEKGSITEGADDDDSPYSRTVGYIPTADVTTYYARVQSVIYYYNEAEGEEGTYDYVTYRMATAGQEYRIAQNRTHFRVRISQNYEAQDPEWQHAAFYKYTDLYLDVNDNVKPQLEEDTNALLRLTGGTIPSYWETEIAASEASVREHRMTAGTALEEFFFITDIHWNVNKKHSTALINRIARDTGIKNVCIGGDIIGTHHDDSQSAAAQEIEDFYRQFDGSLRLFSTIGNHDLNSNNNSGHPETFLSAAQCYALMLKTEELYTDTGATPYYTIYDNPSQKFRLIQIWHPEYIDYGTASEEVQGAVTAVLGAISELDDDWTVAVIAHNYWVSHTEGGVEDKSYVDSYISELVNGISALNANDAKATTAALLVGHKHYDRTTLGGTYENVRVIATMCDRQGGASKETGEGIVVPTMTANTGTEQAFEIVQIDTANKMIYLTRVGAGDDRSFSFDYSE